MQLFTFSVLATLRNAFCSDPLSRALGPDGIGALGKLAQMGGISFAPNQNGDVTQAFEQMQALPIPSVDATAFIDPNLLGEEGACERNYKAKCPIGFVSVSEVFGDGPRCAANNKLYRGRCQDRAIKFAKISKRGRQHWAALCGFQWPCQKCQKNYRDPCPIDWDTDLSLGQDPKVCVARATYVGPCERRVDFSLYNDKTKQMWSEECLSYWPCA